MESGHFQLRRHKSGTFSELILPVDSMSDMHKGAECQPDFWFVGSDKTTVTRLVKAGTANKLEYLYSN